MKYAFLTTGASDYSSLWKHDFVGAGVHNWKRIFDGDLLLYRTLTNVKSELENYDVVHINAAGGDIGLAYEIRTNYLMNSSTKIVLNLDWSIQKQQDILLSINKPQATLISDIIASNHVFGTEIAQYNYLKYVVELERSLGSKNNLPTVNLIVHPIDADRLSKPIDEGGMFIPYDLRLEWFACMYHHADPQLHIPALLLNNLPKSWSDSGESASPITLLLGYTGSADISKSRDIMFDMIQNTTHWPKYFYILAHVLFALDYYLTINSHSRFMLECATLGIAAVCTNNSYSGRFLYPYTSKEAIDLQGLRESIVKIVSDKSFFELVTETALKNVKQFNYTNSKERFERMCKGEEVVITN